MHISQAYARLGQMLSMQAIQSPLWRWLTPALAATLGITSTEQTSRVFIMRHTADPAVFAEAHMLFVGLASLPALMRSSGGLWKALNVVPWWITAIVAFVRVQASVWVGKSVQFAPNPGFAKMVVNLNTVWATAVSPFLFGSTLTRVNLGGVVLSTVGTYLCTTGESQDQDVLLHTRKHKFGIDALMEWLGPGLLASVALTAVEMGSRVLSTRYSAEPGLFMQAQLAMGALVSFGRLVIFEGGFFAAIGFNRYDPVMGDMRQRTSRAQWSETGWRDEPWRQHAWSQVPWYWNFMLAMWRMKWLVWIAQSVQLAPNPGIAKTIMGGGDTVLATLTGVLLYNSQLRASDLLGMAMSLVGTWACTA